MRIITDFLAKPRNLNFTWKSQSYSQTALVFGLFILDSLNQEFNRIFYKMKGFSDSGKNTVLSRLRFVYTPPTNCNTHYFIVVNSELYLV